MQNTPPCYPYLIYTEDFLEVLTEFNFERRICYAPQFPLTLIN